MTATHSHATPLVWIAAVLLMASACAPADDVKLESDNDKALYTLGASVADDLKSRLGYLNLTEAETALFVAGISDQFRGTAKLDLKDPAQSERLESFRIERMKGLAEEEGSASKAFLEKAAQESGAEQTSSGLVYKEIEAGSGDTPSPADTVKVHYHGTLRDGTVFDSSRERGEPVEFAVDGVIPCWIEGLQKMKQGGKARFTCPASIAYADAGAPPKIKPGAALSFEVELLSVTKAGATPPAQ
jgi:FKBP-type peptidyl-prolyl cis-trans isomerase FkpA